MYAYIYFFAVLNYNKKQIMSVMFYYLNNEIEIKIEDSKTLVVNSTKNKYS